MVELFQTALKEHFSTCGIVSCVTVKNVDNEDSRPYALVDFVNRIDAERASQSTHVFSWHFAPGYLKMI